MAKFMDVHSGFYGVTAEQLNEAHCADLKIEGDEGVPLSLPAILELWLARSLIEGI